MNIFVGGVNGAGKTTLLRHVGVLRPEWSVVPSTRGFMEWLGFAGDYERLRRLDPAVRDRALGDFMQAFLAKGQPSSITFLDSHYLNLKSGKVDSVVGEWIGGFDALMLITSPIDTIFPRITEESSTRDRGLFPAGVSEEAAKGILASYAGETRAMFQRLASRFVLPCQEVENLDVSIAAQTVVDFVEGSLLDKPPKIK